MQEQEGPSRQVNAMLRMGPFESEQSAALCYDAATEYLAFNAVRAGIDAGGALLQARARNFETPALLADLLKDVAERANPGLLLTEEHITTIALAVAQNVSCDDLRLANQ